MLRFVVLFLSVSSGFSLLYDCQDWVTYDADQKCLKFVFEPLSYERATTKCADYGATLVSINNAPEHAFINSWLQTHDVSRNVWLTSGRYDTTTMTSLWEGDNSNLDLSISSLVDTSKILNGLTHIVYKYNGIEYELKTESPIKSFAYICEISQADAYTIINQHRDFLFGTANQNLEDALKGPSFISFPENLVMVQDSPQAYIECLASGNPRPTYKWFRGPNFGIEITKDTDTRYTLTNGRLTIQSPSEDKDAGTYRCQIENSFGIIISNPIQISFAFLAEFSNVQLAPVPAIAFEGAVLQCSDIKYKPEVTYNWQRLGANKNREYIYSELAPYIFISNSGDLYFTEVTTVDDTEYYCQATLSGLSDTAVGSSQPPSKTSLPILLSISNSGAKANWGPVIQNDFIKAFPKPPMRGGRVRLECFAYGTASNYINTWSYSWQREGYSRLPSNAVMDDLNRVLILKNAQREDEGTYTCVVRRGNSAVATRSYTLKLQAKPYFLTPLRDQHIDEEAQLTWRCQAGGNPTPTYEWYFNGKLLTGGNDITVNRNILTIQKVDAKKHNGMYQCAAKNDHGTSLSEGQIRVLSFAPTFAKSPLAVSQDAALGGNVTIACTPEAAPQPVITWSKSIGGADQGGTITSGSRVKILPNGNLHITGVTRGDAGFYTCKAENKHGQAQSTSKLNVRSGVVISRKMKIEEEVRVNNTAFFICEASADRILDLVYIWKFNDHEIDFTRSPNYARGTLTNGLFVKKVQFTDEGEYECIARTPLNEARAKGKLLVEGPPGECAGLFADAGSVTTTSIQLYWFNGETNGEPILYYIIQAEGQVEVGTWRTIQSGVRDIDTISSDSKRGIRTFLVTGLHPGNGYKFRIQAANAYGIGAISRESQVYQTKSAPPSRPPSGVTGGGGSVGDLTMTWKRLEYLYQGGPGDGGIGYNVYWRRHSNDPNRQWSKHTMNKVDNTKLSYQYVRTVGEENFYLEYEVKVQAFNVYGHGPNSTEIVIYSAEGMPVAAPEKVYADGFNSTAMDVFWTKVANTREAMKGRVKGYQILYWPNNNDEIPQKQFIRFLGDRSQGRVIGLWADSYFWFQVQVFNTAGLGPVSEKYTQETKNPPPGLYPQEVQVFSHGSESVTIKWRGISTRYYEDTLRGYKIFKWLAKDDPRTAEEIEVDMIPSEHVLYGLKKDTVYAARIAGFSGGGDGVKSPTVFFTLGGTVYSDPTITEILAGASSMVSSLTLILSLLVVAHFIQ